MTDRLTDERLAEALLAIEQYDADFGRKLTVQQVGQLQRAAARLLELRKENERLMRLLQEVAASGVEMEDPRIDYLCIQIAEETWREIWKTIPEVTVEKELCQNQPAQK